MENTRQQLLEKWAPVLDHESLPAIGDAYRREVTAILLENQERELQKEKVALFEAAPGNSGVSIGQGAAGVGVDSIAGYDPVLISLVRRAMPQLMAYDVCGVQPMTQPTGLIFALKSRYTEMSGTEALFNEADSGFSGIGTHAGSDPAAADAWTTDIGAQSSYAGYDTGTGRPPTDGSYQSTTGDDFGTMGFSVERTSVTAKSRALKAEYSLELAQDLKAVHGLDAESELSNILSTEILAEINREIIRTIYRCAKPGAVVGTASTGIFDLDTDSNGRWSVEKFKGLLFQLEREANAIAQDTRRGRGNFIICSSDVASALAMAGVLDYAPALSTKLNVDEASTTFAGVLNGKFKVYVDPYTANQTASQYFVAGYKGSSAFDAGLFYCPYVPLQQVRAVDPASFQPRIGFKTRYGLVANPFVDLADTSAYQGDLIKDRNYYYRKVRVNNIM